MNDSLVIIDGNAMIHRAYHAFPHLTTTKGEVVNAIYGFASMLLVVLDKLDPKYLIVVFDEKDPTFRHQQFTQYKSTRKPMEDDLAEQIDKIWNLVDCFKLKRMSYRGYEADDVIGTIVKKLTDRELKKIIVSGDRDLMQLIRDDVVMFIPQKTFGGGEIFGVKEFTIKYGLKEPDLMRDLKALMGDASDNIPGVHGIGEKGAMKLVQEFGTLENIYNNIEKIDKKTKDKLIEQSDMAAFSKELVTIHCDVPIDVNISECEIDGIDWSGVKKIFEQYEFKSLLKKIPNGINNDKQAADTITDVSKKVSNKSLFSSTDSEDDFDTRVEKTRLDLEKYLEGQPDNIKDLDFSMIPVLERMKVHGVLVDKECLEKLSNDFESKLTELVADIYSDVGHEFNLNSPKQLSEVLFDELKLPVIKKTKTGRSTNEEVLLRLQDGHVVVKKLLKYRELFKLKSTYIDGLPKYIADDSRIHSTFHLDIASTGRLSSTDPNLQNIPIRSDWGTEIRNAFVALDGYVFLAMDYSQIELRILAHLTQDEEMMRIFRDGEDIHASTAAKMFHKKVTDVTSDERRSAKTINFGLMYGMGPRALSQDLGVTFEEAQHFIDAYFGAFPKIAAWRENLLKSAKENGYVESMLGRRRMMPELKSPVMQIRAAGERMTINMPCQGTQSEMIKLAMVRIDDKIQNSKIKIQKDGDEKYFQESDIEMILQIHDELIFEVKEGALDSWIPVLSKEMSEALPLSIPVEVGVKVGKRWGEMKSYLK